MREKTMKKVLLVASIVAGLAMGTTVNVMAAPSASVTVSGSVDSSTCDVSLDKSAIQIPSLVSDWAGVAKDALLTKGVQDLALTVANCGGAASGAVTMHADQVIAGSNNKYFGLQDVSKAIGVVVGPAANFDVAHLFAQDQVIASGAVGTLPAITDLKVGLVAVTDGASVAKGNTVNTTLTFAYNEQ